MSRQFVGCFALISVAGCGSGYRTDAAIAVAPTLPPVAAPPPVADPPIVVVPTTFSAELNASSIFIGASIIHGWPLPMHNAGISGQTSVQVLQRFSGDVVGHGYARVIIQVGTNDVLLQVRDPPDTVAANLDAMGQIAQAAGMEVALISLGPITSNGVNMDVAAAAVNAKISQLAASRGYLFVDIFTPLQGHPEWFLDGYHPNAQGYAVMEKALAQVVTK